MFIIGFVGNGDVRMEPSTTYSPICRNCWHAPSSRTSVCRCQRRAHWDIWLRRGAWRQWARPDHTWQHPGSLLPLRVESIHSPVDPCIISQFVGHSASGRHLDRRPGRGPLITIGTGRRSRIGSPFSNNAEKLPSTYLNQWRDYEFLEINSYLTAASSRTRSQLTELSVEERLVNL